jgi:RNA polymerase sigma factor (sigma-70 family)
MDWVEEKFTQIQHRSGDTLREKLALLDECVEALSDENRNAIEARYMDGCSLSEIAKRLDIARETVKKRLYRAKTQLAKCIEGKLLLGEEVA